MKAMTEDEIRQAFDVVDREGLTFPHLAEAQWGERDFLAWRHPSGGKAFLVVDLPERAVGLVLRFGASSNGAVCDLCCGVDRELGALLMLVETWAKPRTSHGLMICAGLDCGDSVRDKKWVYRMGETLPTGRRIERLQANLERFVREVSGVKAGFAS